MQKKILILEDEKEIAQLYAKRLQEKGYEVELAYNGLEGLEKLKKFIPDLICLDLGMPKMNGIDFYQQICDANNKPRYHVLVLTGRADLETLFKDFQVDGLIIKPFSGMRLLSEIEIIFNKNETVKIRGLDKKVIIVDDRDSAEKILEEFIKAGYAAELVTSGVAGIEKIMSDPPDLAMICLSLNDLSGDIVILRLQQIARTKRVHSMLYVQRNFVHDKIVMDTYALKSGVKLMFEYNEPAELIGAAAEVFRRAE